MITINKQDIVKTILIIWFVGTTVYVANDLYTGYKIRGIQAAYQQGYAQSVGDLIQKVQGSNCQPVEVKKDNNDLKLIDTQCLQQQGQGAQAAQPQTVLPAKPQATGQSK